MTIAASSRLARCWVVALVAAAALWVAPAARASASQVQIGVWWQGQPDGGSLPYPPQVPAGGLWVASEPAGPSAVSALRFALEDGDRAPVVTLPVAKLTGPPDSPATRSAVPLLACRATSAWTPTDPAAPGAWGGRPTYDCAAGQVAGVVSTDGTTVSFDLTTLAAPGTPVSIAIVPGTVANPVPAAPAPLPVGPSALPAPADPLPAPPDPTSSSAWPTFDAAFAPVTAGSIAVIPGTSAAPADSSGSASATIIGDGAATAVLPATGVETFEPSVPPAASTGASPAVPRVQLAPARSARPAAALRVVSRWRQLALGLILTALCAWAWEAMQGSGGLLGGSRPVLSLYDTPVPDLRTGPRQVLARLPRVGKPPSLR